jgi:hypothetical protein
MKDAAINFALEGTASSLHSCSQTGSHSIPAARSGSLLPRSNLSESSSSSIRS